MCGWSPWQRTPQAIQGHSPLSSLAHCSHPYSSLLPGLSHWREFRLSHENSTSSAYSVSSWREYSIAPCFCTDYGGFAQNPSSMAVPSTGMDVLDHQTLQLRWEPASCNSKRRMSIGSNHHSSVHWTSRCCFPDCNLCSSPQLLLVHWASRPRMLSPWRQPCEWWWIPFYNNISVWFILAMDLEHLGHLFIRMQAHPADSRVGWLHLGFQHLLQFIPCHQGRLW